MALQLVKDSAISHLVQLALDKACSFLQDGDGRLPDVQNEVEKIKGSLGDVRDFIVIAERSPVRDPKLMKLLKRLKDAAYDADDILEEYEIEKRRKSAEAQSSMPVRDTMTNKVRKVVTSLVTPFMNDVDMAKKLKELSERLETIKVESHDFKLSETVMKLEIEFKKQRETHSFVNESQVFGRDEEKEKIVSLLLSPHVGHGTEHENVSVISIVGMGGLGKTTLAQLVFNHERVQNHFDLKMWICVSDDFDVIELGNTIIKRATCRDNPNLSDVEELHAHLRKELSGKRFLLVLDDVWNEAPEKWYKLRDLLICGGGRGSRVIVTTRSRKVASIMSKIEPQILEGLPDDDCWSLFSRRAFGNPSEEEAHPNLVLIGREMVKKCKGNPLAVTTLGGLLCCERGESKWAFVRDSETWNLDGENEFAILPALRLSYSHLKPHLKQCFAFCAIFPKDYAMEKELVIRLWMANGFIPLEPGKELEDVGNDIFNELVFKSFFQDATEALPDFFSPLNVFRMHDLMHDLAQSVMENEYCIVEGGKSINISQMVRYLSSDGTIPKENLVASLPKAHMLRTYAFLVTTHSDRRPSQFHRNTGAHRFLRALDLGKLDWGTEKLSLNSLENLQHLRYLDLSDSSIDMLPESLSSLHYLQTLILSRCSNLLDLPKEMGNLSNLRCLDISECFKLTHMPAKMGQLSCLQELHGFIVGRTDEFACSGIGELQSLNLIRHLIIERLQNITDVKDVQRAHVIGKPNLTFLHLSWEHDLPHLEDLRMEEIKTIEEVEEQVLQGLQPHRNLEALSISYYGGIGFPSWMMDTAFTKLVVITFYSCWRCKHLPPLGQLPLLKFLVIHGLRNVESIGDDFYGNEESGGFPSLEVLWISNIQKLRTWSAIGWKGERVFPSLISLSIINCPMLTRVTCFPYFKDFNTNSSLGSVTKPFQQELMRYLENLENLMSTVPLFYPDNEAPVERERITKILHFISKFEYLSSHMRQSLRSSPEGIKNFRSLRTLYISQCRRMESLPGELQQYLPVLLRLYIGVECPILRKRYEENTGEDWHKIRHIPSVHISLYGVRGRTRSSTKRLIEGCSSGQDREQVKEGGESSCKKNPSSLPMSRET